MSGQSFPDIWSKIVPRREIFLRSFKNVALGSNGTPIENGIWPNEQNHLNLPLLPRQRILRQNRL